MKAFLEREAISEDSRCKQCQGLGVARWQCCDCMFPDLLCRKCMRHSHKPNPFHRIQYWTGSYFRQAELREVGLFIIVKHSRGGMCDTLISLQTQFEASQMLADDQDLSRAVPEPSKEVVKDFNNDPVLNSMEEDGKAFEEYMDQLYRNKDKGEGSGMLPDWPGHRSNNSDLCCVVHTNGVHHLKVITCGCQGIETTFSDLASACFLPTSFSQLSTLFTTLVLDDFRVTNLECKASAYQYWEKLRRITNPLFPAKVANRYKELLRMSQLWRWMKKLK